jgi:ComF family protein
MFVYSFLRLNTCLICQIDRAIKYNLCEFCYSILPWINKNQYRCIQCHKELFLSNKSTCDNCMFSSNYFNKIFAVFYYQQPIKYLLLHLKFKQNLAYADSLGGILSESVLNNWYKNQPLPQSLIPMPLHINRLRARGFNQSFELARGVSNKIKIDTNLCVRTKNTKPQNNLLKNSRKINVQSAFIINKMPYKHIAILDDILTTGNTIMSLCSAIKKVNPDIIIDIWCIARA